MQVRALGDVDVVDDAGNTIAIGGPVQVKLLAIFVASRGQEIPVGDIATELWDHQQLADDPVASVRTYVARLRQPLGSEAVITGNGTYRFGDVETDVELFEQLVQRARRASGSPTASELWRQALDLWRGSAFGSHAELASIRPEASRLEELRAEAHEAWFDARLVAGEGRELVSEIETAVGVHPLHEGFRAQQMTALARAGRRAEALRAFQNFRADLTEVGLEPSPRLQELDGQIASGEVPRSGARRTLRGYKIGEQLGEGAFAIVYAATQASVGRQVAIKQIRGNLADQPEFVRQFEAEAHLVARLEHPHIVPLYDYWREPGSAYLVMRYLEGGGLQQRVLDRDLSLEQLVPMVGQVAAALDEAHSNGVIHRDVKPANVLLDSAGNAYLSDFGIAVEEAERLDPEAWLSNGSPAYAAPEQLRREAVGPQADVYALGVTIYEALTGDLPFPQETTMAGLLERQLNDPVPLVRTRLPHLPAAVDTVIRKATAKDAANRYERAGELARDLAAAAGLEDDDALIEPDDRNPYKGLRPFDEADASDFVGRERLVSRLVETVAAHRVTAVVGPSGSGKSSVVRAGLVPALRGGGLPGSGSWFVTSMIPGADPFADLEAALLRVAVDPPAELGGELRSSDRGLARALRQIIPDDRQLLLLVDQFEELFTLAADSASQAFLDALVDAATGESPRLRLVLSIRADFYDHPLHHPAFARLIEASTVAVHPLEADELERAIRQPAAAVGASFESGLVARITADFADEPGALPLLQYALTELFERREGHTLTVVAYELTGGVAGALAGRAEELYLASTSEEQAALRSMFGRLVNIGEGAEDTRRRVVRSELSSGEATDAALARYGAARLLSFDRDPATRDQTVEVAHEALIRAWPRYRTWLEEDRDGLRILRHLSEAAHGWDRGRRPAAELYRGGRLEAAEEWAADHGDELNEVESGFLTAGLDQRQAEAEADRAQVSRLRRLLSTVAVVAAIALIAGVVAFIQRNRANDEAARANAQTVVAEEQTELAETNAAEAEARQTEAELNALVSRSVAESRNRSDLGLLLAVAAYDACDACIDGQGALLSAIAEAPPRVESLRLDASNAWSSGAYEELGLARWIIRTDTGPQLVDASSGEIVVTPLATDGHGQFLLGEGRTSPDGMLTSPRADGRVPIVETVTGEEVSAYVPPGPIRDMRWFPDGKRYLVVWLDPETEAPSVDIVDTASAELQTTYPLPFVPMGWVVGPNGHALLAREPGPGNPEPSITIFDLADGTVGPTYDAPFGVGDKGFAAADRDVLGIDGFEDIFVIDAERETEPVIVYPGPEGTGVGGLTSDGSRLIVGQESGIKAYETTTGRWVDTIGLTVERASGSVTADDQYAQFTESGLVEVYDTRSAPNAESTVITPAPALISEIAPADDLLGVAVIGTHDYLLQSVETGDELARIQPGALHPASEFVVPGVGEGLGAAGAIFGSDLTVVPFRRDGTVLPTVDLWPSEEPRHLAAVLTGGQTNLVFGLVTGDAALEVRDRRSVLPQQLLVVDLETFEPEGEPIDLAGVVPVYRAVPRPDGSIIALHIDQTASHILPDGSIEAEVFRVDDDVVQMKTDRSGQNAVLLYGDGGAVTVDLSTFEVSDPIVGLPGHRDVRFTDDGGALLIQDGRARTLLYDLQADREVGFIAGGGFANAGAGSGIVVTEQNTVWVNRTKWWLEVSLDPADWRAEACRLAGRELTDDEWEELVPGDIPRRDLCS